MRHAPGQKAAGDRLAVVVLVGEAEGVADLVAEEADVGDIRPQAAGRMGP